MNAKKIKIEFTIKNADYSDYEEVLQNFEHDMAEIGYTDLEITETDTDTQIDYVGKVAEIVNTEDEGLNNFIENFCEKYKLKSLLVLITNQEDDNLWGEIIGTDEPLPYHFEIKDVVCFYY